MDKLRLRLLVCLIMIFAVTIIGFVLAIAGSSDGCLSGAAVTGGIGGTTAILVMFLPGILFIGFLILTIIYLERN
ncbi:hypothetical protein JW898_00235 [Candidatus Woesearchaeota archaeon]|nr:hypothetical protein [Candidatus Woesearchaeota archaeon]